MTNVADELKTALSIAAAVISLVSLYFTRVNWLQSNRPIITAYIDEYSSGQGTTIFNLSVTNTGNRPAVRIRLHDKREEIRSLVEPTAEESRFSEIEACFQPESEIPVLENGKALTTSFGAASLNSPNGPWLKYGQGIEISVTYKDMEGRAYKSMQPLLLKPRNGFGGGTWNDAKT